jgi:predicted TIM-barrel fold metal-dependent hydrolase
VDAFIERSGVESFVLLSRCPIGCADGGRANIETLAALRVATGAFIRPFAWIDPTHESACEILEWAVRDCGMVGVKLLPQNFHPEDPRARGIYELAGALNVPILIHTGILWSPGANANNCRPGNVEVLWDYPKTRFAMAHIGWPWTDECIAVAQKLNRMRPELDQAFVDLTPGTPPSYRESALAKCLENVHADHMLYGSDSGIPTNTIPEGNWQRDREIFDRLGVSAEDQQRIFAGNAERFLRRR